MAETFAAGPTVDLRQSREFLGLLFLHQLVPHRVPLAFRQLQSVLRNTQRRRNNDGKRRVLFRLKSS